MGMGYAACYDFVVLIPEIKKAFPKEFSRLLSALDSKNLELEDIARDYAYEEALPKELGEDVVRAFGDLRQAFKDRFNIKLYLNYHSSEEQGDRYDDVNGAFFCLEWTDAMMFTPALESLTHSGVRFDLQSWVRFG